MRSALLPSTAHRVNAEVRRREPVMRFGPGTATSRVTKTKQPVQVADIRAEPAYANDPQRLAFLELAGARTILAVPMLKEDEVVGVILIYRQEVQPLTEKQIAFVQNFAAQAVIAIENARLLNELRQRTADLTQRTTDLTEALSSKRQRLKCFKSSVALPAIWNQCLRPSWNMLYASAMPNGGTSTYGTARPSTSPRRITYRPPTSHFAEAIHITVPIRRLCSVACSDPGGYSNRR